MLLKKGQYYPYPIVYLRLFPHVMQLYPDTTSFVFPHHLPVDFPVLADMKG